jgi:HAD superfamily hydrolase (TIGR01549 family)
VWGAGGTVEEFAGDAVMSVFGRARVLKEHGFHPQPEDVEHGEVTDRPIKAVVFDMDGTLIDSATVIPDAYIACITALGGPFYTPPEIIAVGPPEAMLTHLLGRPSSAAEVDDYHVRLERLARGVTVYPGIGETLATLASQVPLAVFTGASIRACRILLRPTGLLGYFTALVGGDEIARPKPYPDGILEVCRRIGVNPPDAAYVGDAPNDLRAARRSGALAFAAAWGHQYQPDEPSDGVLERPAELVDYVMGRRPASA